MMGSALLLLQTVATFTFTNGAEVKITRDSTRQEDPVAISITQGLRFATQRLDVNTARSWAYLIAWASRTGSGFLIPDSLTAQARAFLGFTTTVTCGKWGCRATIFNIQLWGSNYAYLRPGPLPLAECFKFGQALMKAGGWPVLNAPAWPYVWTQ